MVEAAEGLAVARVAKEEAGVMRGGRVAKVVRVASKEEWVVTPGAVVSQVGEEVMVGAVAQVAMMAGKEVMVARGVGMAAGMEAQVAMAVTRVEEDSTVAREVRAGKEAALAVRAVMEDAAVQTAATVVKVV